MSDFLLLAFVFLCAGVVAVPIASRLGLGSVLGYLLAGIALSPLLAAINVDVVAIQHFAEFGVVMMLFLVGLELAPQLLWQMRNRLLGLGGLQVVGTALAVMGVALAFGQPWKIALTIGLVLSLSSTAIVLQTLNEKGLMRSDGGQGSFSVLLFQDIAVIPILALLPFLAMASPEAEYGATSGRGAHGQVAHGTDGGHGEESVSRHGGADAGYGGTPAHRAEPGDAHHVDASPGSGAKEGPDDRRSHDAQAKGGHGHGADDGHKTALSLVNGLPTWLQALITLAAIVVVIIVGQFLIRPLFRFIAMARLRELFTAAALMIVVGIALLMSVVGLSPALGTFLAGVVLATSEYRHELESDVAPFKGLLLGLFFITVGASVNFSLLAENATTVVGLTLGIMTLKATVLLILASIFRIRGGDRWLFALGLSQAGEFGFVLLSLTVQENVLPPGIAEQLLLVVAMSMLLTPALFIAYDWVVAPRFSAAQTREADEMDEQNSIIIAGHGRWGGIVNRMLRGAGFETTVLDYSSEQLEMLRAFDFKVFFGDATRPDLLHAAGIENARMLVVAIDDRHLITELTGYVLKNHPHVHVLARAIDRRHVYELYALGCRDIIRETFDSGVRAGRSAFEALGVHPFEAEHLARRFVKDDRAAIAALSEVYDPDVPIHQNQEYVKRAKAIREALEAEMRGSGRAFSHRSDRGWSPPTLKDVGAHNEHPDE